MKSHPRESYVRYFQTFATKEIKKYTSFTDIGRFAISLNLKVNQMIKHVNDEKVTDLYDLELTLINCGKDYIRQFSQQFKPHVPNTHYENLTLIHPCEYNEFLVAGSKREDRARLAGCDILPDLFQQQLNTSSSNASC